MPIKDLRSNLNMENVLNVADDANATISTPYFSIGGAESVTILLSSSKVAGGSTITITGINESNDISGTPNNPVSTDKIIGDLTKTGLDNINASVTISRVGVFATRPFISVDLSQSGTPLNNVMVSLITEPLLIPAINPED